MIILTAQVIAKDLRTVPLTQVWSVLQGLGYHKSDFEARKQLIGPSFAVIDSGLHARNIVPLLVEHY